MALLYSRFYSQNVTVFDIILLQAVIFSYKFSDNGLIFRDTFVTFYCLTVAIYCYPVILILLSVNSRSVYENSECFYIVKLLRADTLKNVWIYWIMKYALTGQLEDKHCLFQLPTLMLILVNLKNKFEKFKHSI